MDMWIRSAGIGAAGVALLGCTPIVSSGLSDSRAQHAGEARVDKALDPASYKREFAVPLTKVMVFGLGHLDGAPDSFKTEWLEPVLCRLRAYRPDVIVTEAMSGEQIMGLDAYADYHGDAGAFAGPTLEMAKTAQSDLGLTAAQALVKANALSARDDLEFADRRRLAALFVAAAEPFSATVQWMRLPSTQRVPADGVTSALVARLNRFAALRNELTSIAARLAADIGLNRVYGAGDHASDVTLPSSTALTAASSAEPNIVAQFNHDTPEFRSIPEEAMQLSVASEVMPVMKWKNSIKFGVMDANAQWFSMLRSDAYGVTGRQRVAAWEAQNLRMAVSIREVTAPIAGGRALVVVGASHKPFIEAYLRTFTDIELVSVPALLDARPDGCAA